MLRSAGHLQHKDFLLKLWIWRREKSGDLPAENRRGPEPLEVDCCLIGTAQ
jgi:hypothetical protein